MHVLARYIIVGNSGYSNPARIVIAESLVPIYLGPLAHVVVVPQRLAILGHAFLRAVLEVFGLLKTFRTHHTLQEDILVLFAGSFVLLSRWAQQAVEGLKDSVQPSVETIVIVLSVQLFLPHQL